MAQMIEVGDKPEVKRTATAEGWLRLKPSTLAAIGAGEIKKCDPFAVAEVAAIQAVKETPRILPLCHPLPVTGVAVKLRLEAAGVHATVSATVCYKTGLEMEALTGVAAALLTVWDMTKYLEKDGAGQYPETRIEGLRVVNKSKGGEQ